MVQDQPTGDKNPITPIHHKTVSKSPLAPTNTSTAFGDSVVQEDREKTPDLEATEEEKKEMAEYAIFRRFTKLRQLEKRRKPAEKSTSGVEKFLSFSSGEEEDNDEYAYVEDSPPKVVRTGGGSGSKEGVRAEVSSKGKGFATRVTNIRKHPIMTDGVQIKSPFSEEINNTPVPEGMKAPRVDMYDGTGDPDDHVANFQWAARMMGMSSNLLCLYFAGTLKGSARYWFSSLPQGSIFSFGELVSQFSHSFIQQKKFQQKSHSIMACRQREGESNKAYYKRFNEQSRKMPVREDSMIIAAFTHGLREGELFRDLTKRDFEKADDMIEVINKTIKQEEESAEKLRFEAQEKRGTSGSSVRTVDTRYSSGRSSRTPVRGRSRNMGKERYEPYRPESHRPEVFAAAEPKGQKGDRKRYPRDPNAYCDFHKKMGHSTADCVSYKWEKESQGKQAVPIPPPPPPLPRRPVQWFMMLK